MKPSPRFVGRAGSVLTRKLAQYARYSELLGEQEGALEEGDMDAFKDLALQADRVRKEVDQGSEELSVEEQEHAAQIIKEAVARSRRIKERVSGLRGEAADGIREMTRREPQARSYLSEANGSSEARPRLDVRS